MDPPKRRCFWHYASAQLENLRMYISDFPWNDYCFQVRDPSMCAQRITEVIISGMEAYIPHTFSTHAKKAWFNHTCSRTIKDREVAHKRYLSLPSPTNHNFYISSRYWAISFLRLTKNSFINGKSQNLTNSNSPKNFWHLAKNISPNFTSSSFPPLIALDGSTAVTSISKAELFAQTFSKNSSLDESGHIPPLILSLSSLWLISNFLRILYCFSERKIAENKKSYYTHRKITIGCGTILRKF